MQDPRIEPPKITKPIQLLAAWLAGLVLANGSFLTTAALITTPSWAPGALVVAAIANVPLFLFCLFLLQTKFRPEMQEDEFYHRYLEKRYSALTGKTEIVESSSMVAPRTKSERQLVRHPDPFESTIRSDREETQITINDMLPSYSALIADLQKVGIRLQQTFGSTSENPRIPKPFVVSFGEGAPIATLKNILRVAQKHGIEGLAFARNMDFSANRIYIGAYSYDDPKNQFLRLTEDNIRFLTSPETTDEEFLSKIPFRENP